MARNNVRGLVPSRNLHGGSKFRTKQYVVSSANGENLFQGDVVKLVGGKIEACSGAISEYPVGVIKAIYTATGRPLTHSLPDNAAYRIGSNSADSLVDVYDDPGVVFRAQANATATTALVGKVATISAGAGSTTTGQSGHEINITYATAAVTAGASAAGMVRVLGLAPVELGVAASANDVEVIFRRHLYHGGE